MNIMIVSNLKSFIINFNFRVTARKKQSIHAIFFQRKLFPNLVSKFIDNTRNQFHFRFSRINLLDYKILLNPGDLLMDG